MNVGRLSRFVSLGVCLACWVMLSGCVKWQKNEFFDAGFSVEVPGFLKKKDTHEKRIGSELIKGANYTLKKRGVEFIIGVSNYLDIVNAVEPSRYLRLVPKMMNRLNKGHSDFRLKVLGMISRQGKPGIDLHIYGTEKGQKIEVRNRVYLNVDKGKVYHVVITAGAGKHNKEWTKRFFKSFRMISLTD